MSWQLRPATREDAPVIRRLIRQAGINPLGLDWRRFLLAMDEADQSSIRRDRCIGCGQLKPHAGGTLELASIAVVPEWRRRGVASQVIQALIERSKTLPCSQETVAPALYLTCRAGLRSFYERFGFVVLAPDTMPLYFKGAYYTFRLIKSVGLARENLLVMYRQADPADDRSQASFRRI